MKAAPFRGRGFFNGFGAQRIALLEFQRFLLFDFSWVLVYSRNIKQTFASAVDKISHWRSQA